MNAYRLGLIAAVAATVLGWNLSAAQAQEPGVALQRALTENRIRKGLGDDIVRGPQADLQALNQGALVASPSTDTVINISDAGSTSALREITRSSGPNSDR